MRIKNLILIIFVCASTTTHGEDTKCFKGHWTKVNTSWDFQFELGICIGSDNKVLGILVWEPLEIDPSAFNYYKNKIGRKANEYLTGTFYPQSGKLILTGISKDDPYGIIALDEYVLFITNDNIIGKSKENTNLWRGRIRGEKASASTDVKGYLNRVKQTQTNSSMASTANKISRSHSVYDTKLQNLEKKMCAAEINNDGTSTVNLGFNSRITEDEIALWMADVNHLRIAQHMHDLKYSKVGNERYVTSFKVIKPAGANKFMERERSRQKQDSLENKRQDAGATLILALGAAYVNNISKASTGSSSYRSTSPTTVLKANSTNSSTSQKDGSKEKVKSNDSNENKDQKVVYILKEQGKCLDGFTMYYTFYVYIDEKKETLNTTLSQKKNGNWINGCVGGVFSGSFEGCNNCTINDAIKKYTEDYLGISTKDISIKW